MQVKIRKSQDGKSWHVTALDGPFADKLVATCEGMSLRKVDFSDEYIVGFPTAIWGAEIDEMISNSHYTIAGLGLGRAFDCRVKKPAVFNGDFYADANTRRPLGSVRGVSVFMSGIFYRE
ncbi:MAG: hypothetical protein WA045_00485 [Nitrospira sp.]